MRFSEVFNGRGMCNVGVFLVVVFVFEALESGFLIVPSCCAEGPSQRDEVFIAFCAVQTGYPDTTSYIKYILFSL